jgi:hypothetical protein
MPRNEPRNLDLNMWKRFLKGESAGSLQRWVPAMARFRCYPTRRFASDGLDLPPALLQILYYVLVQTARHILESALLHRQAK